MENNISGEKTDLNNEITRNNFNNNTEGFFNKNKVSLKNSLFKKNKIL